MLRSVLGFVGLRPAITKESTVIIDASAYIGLFDIIITDNLKHIFWSKMALGLWVY